MYLDYEDGYEIAKEEDAKELANLRARLAAVTAERDRLRGALSGLVHATADDAEKFVQQVHAGEWAEALAALATSADRCGATIHAIDLCPHEPLRGLTPTIDGRVYTGTITPAAPEGGRNG